MFFTFHAFIVMLNRSFDAKKTIRNKSIDEKHKKNNTDKCLLIGCVNNSKSHSAIDWHKQMDRDACKFYCVLDVFVYNTARSHSCARQLCVAMKAKKSLKHHLHINGFHGSHVCMYVDRQTAFKHENDQQIFIVHSDRIDRVRCVESLEIGVVSQNETPHWCVAWLCVLLTKHQMILR